MIEIRHETRGPYAERTVIEWPGLTTESEANDRLESLNKLRDDDPDDLRNEIAELTQELETTRDDANEADEKIERLTSLVDDAFDIIEALLSRKRGSVETARDLAETWREAAIREAEPDAFCTHCVSSSRAVALGQVTTLGRCKRHGKRVRRAA